MRIFFKDKYRMQLIEKLRKAILQSQGHFSLMDMMTASYSDSIMELKMILKKYNKL